MLGDFHARASASHAWPERSVTVQQWLLFLPRPATL